MKRSRTQILVRGIVQGVGFRPYVYGLASIRQLNGCVINNLAGVLIDVEGEASEIDHFYVELQKDPPPLSTIESVTRKDGLPNRSFREFQILTSETDGHRSIPISPDISICDDCVAELFDQTNRRYRYPFINCTNCGPRFTIVENVPYDRGNTTMGDFEMCAACRAEYEDQLDRRFHAQPTCCSECGPTAVVSSRPKEPDVVGNDESVRLARELIAAGKIVAVKGIGGYHLVCDALNPDAVERLRQRKYREEKPFALMTASVETIRKYCDVSDAEATLLTSVQRPIVLLAKSGNTEIPDSIAPGVSTLGFMLPYTPLHYLLLEDQNGPLVMTSGNVANEPICYRNEDADSRLAVIADHFLAHDRRIHIRTDDSVARVIKKLPHAAGPSDKTMILRRARGFAPTPLRTAFKFSKQILACGAELKNTFCLAKDNHAFISHHIGDLGNLETLQSFTEGIEHLTRLFDLAPEVVAYDLHPEYLSTKYALSRDDIETKIGIQHHHAHVASCMADNEAEGEVIGVAMDGLGFGTDGKMWGGEFFVADYSHAERIAHLDYVPMPGGAWAIREPWRMAAVYLQTTFGNEFLDITLPFAATLDRKKWSAVSSMIASKTNCPGTSSMGRLFDAMAALLCLRGTASYEGQAAIALESVADKSATHGYEFKVTDSGIIKSDGLIKKAVGDLIEGVSAAVVSARFHIAVATLIAHVATNLRDERNLARVALSGGVFQNVFLLEYACKLLTARGFEVLTHNRVPTNDGGISFGQAAVANAQIQAGRL